MNEATVRRIALQMGDIFLVQYHGDIDEESDHLMSMIVGWVESGRIPEGAAISVIPHGFSFEVMTIKELEETIEELQESLIILKECMQDALEDETNIA